MAKKKPGFQPGRLRDCISVRHDNISEGWEQWYLLRGCAHHDSPKTSNTLEKRHLDEAIDIGAGILDLGDSSDGMQAPKDPRRSATGAKPEHRVRDYFNAIIRDAAKFYGPYADNWVFFGDGNHERAVLKNNAIDLVDLIVDKINGEHNTGIIHASYSGWVKFFFNIHGTRRTSKNMYFTHGRGGQAPVSRGVIQTNRRSVYTPDADIIVSAHTHDAWVVPIARNRLSTNGKRYQDRCLHIQLPSYKRPRILTGWEEEMEFAPKPTGAYWLKFVYKRGEIKVGAEEVL